MTCGNIQCIQWKRFCSMMTSSNRNIFRVTGLLWGEFTGNRWIPLTKASKAEIWCFRRSAPQQTFEQTVKTAVIRDGIALIMKPPSCLLWLHKGIFQLAAESCDVSIDVLQGYFSGTRVIVIGENRENAIISHYAEAAWQNEAYNFDNLHFLHFHPTFSMFW